MTKHRILLSLTTVVILLIVFVVVELLIVKFNGSPVPAPNIPRNTQILGTGKHLEYVVMGDSTSIGQGTSYPHSYAYASAHHLAKKYQVRFTNVGVSGARAQDLQSMQLSKVTPKHPDLVLIGVGANDVTHFTSYSSVRHSLQTVVDRLKQNNPQVRIVLTGSPAMGSVSRFPWPLKQFAGYRARHMNLMFEEFIGKNKLTLAPVAARTGPAFAHDPTLFARDNFHPNGRGYELWIPVINEALDHARRS